MKRGLIVYLGQESPPPGDWDARAPVQADLEVDEVRIATSEPEVCFEWWRLLARGVARIQLVHGRYDAAQNRLVPTGERCRVSG